ncbi:MAG: glutamine synthetase III [Clostridiales bacterium]|jgi:glutamine synthetase|nr:glutamine synthetase III [Clostridiales bacterium]
MSNVGNLKELFSSMVFNEKVMKERLPKDTYKSLKKTISEGSTLDLETANVVANAMKDWAIEKGATHFTHWFQPMTGITAEKHDSFISPLGDGSIIMEFSGKELIKGEPDASSFPSGGLRATFEARGYTAWDPTSYAFVKENTLFIPTLFCSYGGEALDKKTPLLRSMEALNTQALRILKLFGSEAKRVFATIGSEQEYFLINEEHFRRRKDLVLTGRTLFGAKPPKGQELEDHYFGTIKPNVIAYMHDLDEELWKLGISAKTEHNEVAPSQHELAPVFSMANIAVDQNQLTMDVMRKVAKNHKLVCLLHEKPFAGINGSGKHNNWSISTDTGENLLDPGKAPEKNKRFLLFLVAIIKAVNEYQDLLRVSAASAANDHRLGANEAPPAIISVYLGTVLTDILEAIEKSNGYVSKELEKVKSVSYVPEFIKDNTDRNRTSPFAFTGNKFEFRMLGSSQSISGPNFVLNTIVAEELKQFADILEKADDFDAAVTDVIRKVVRENKQIIFNGNNYSDEWTKEAARRGLSNLKNTVEALPSFIAEKSVKLFTSHGILTEKEVFSRHEILLESYWKIINIEALTVADIVKKAIIPAVYKYLAVISESTLKRQKLALPLDFSYDLELVSKVSALKDKLQSAVNALDTAVAAAKDIENTEKKARFYSETVIGLMTGARVCADELETLVSSEFWPFPTYSDILFAV